MASSGGSGIPAPVRLALWLTAGVTLGLAVGFAVGLARPHAWDQQG